MGKGNSILLLLLVLFAGCTENMQIQETGDDQRIRFTVAEEDVTLTRAVAEHLADASVTPLASDGSQPLFLHTYVEQRKAADETRATEVTSISDFGVSGYTYNATTPLASQYANFFFNAHCTKIAGGSDWTTSTPYYWPASGDKLAFYAYWPYDATAATVKGGNASETGPMQVSYTVDSDITQQVDLLTAHNDGLSFAPLTPVPLTFTHPLTQINFELGEDVAPGKITNVQFDYIATSGVYTIGKGWTPGAINSTPFVISLIDANGVATTTGTGSKVSQEKFFMVPQTFNPSQPIHARITMTLDDGTEQHSLHADLTQAWQPNTVVTYQVSTSSINYLRAEDVTYPADWGGEAFPFKTAYSDGESIGIYATDASGKVVAANVQLTNDNGKWTMSTADRTTMAYDKTYHYYAYYPYSSAISGGHKVNDNVTAGTTAEDFFADVLTSWTVTADQSTSEKLLANDLHICKATAGTSNTQMRFPMQHAMGLGKLILDSRHLPNTLYTLKTDANYQFNDYIISIMASDNFTNAEKACPSTTKNNENCERNDTYYYIQKPNNSVTFIATPTVTGEDTDQWEESAGITFTTQSGESSIQTAHLLSTSWAMTKQSKSTATWTLAVGNVYFADGALGSNATSYPKKKYDPVGIVYSTSMTTTDSNAGFKHGYVVSAMFVGGANATYRWCSDLTTNTNSGYVTNNTYATITGEMDGRTRTNRIKSVSGFSQSKFPAAYAALNPGFACPAAPRSSGWFLPSIGQLNEWARAMYSPGNASTGNSGVYYSGKAPDCATSINNYFKNRGFVDGKTFNQINWSSSAAVKIWSSTEYNVQYPWRMGFEPLKNLTFYRNADNRNSYFRVRPFLAF